MWSREYLRTAVMLTLQWPAMLLATYGLQAWFSMIFVQLGVSVQSSIAYSSIMILGGVFGAFVVPPLLQRFGRKAVLITFAGLCLLSALAYGAVLGNIVLMVIFGMLFNFTIYAVGQISNTYTSELWPTSLRNTGVAYANFIGRAGAIAGPIALGALMGLFGTSAAVYFAASMLLIVAVAVWLLGKETKGVVFTSE